MRVVVWGLASKLALPEFMVTLTDSLNYINWCVISSELETGSAHLIPTYSTTFISFLFNCWEGWKPGPGCFSSAALSLNCTVPTIYFFFFFLLKSNTNFCSTDGGRRYYGGNNLRGEEREGHSGGERYCHAWRGCMLWGMTRWLRQKTGNKRRGQIEWWGQKMGEESGERQWGVEGGRDQYCMERHLGKRVSEGIHTYTEYDS